MAISQFPNNRSTDAELTGTCSHCHGEFDLNTLNPLPSVDAFIRNIGTPAAGTTPVPKPEDLHILLCPACLAKWKEQHPEA